MTGVQTCALPISSGSGGKGNGVCRTCYGRGSDKGKYRSRLLFGSPDKICASEKPAYRTDERSCGELPEMDLWMGEIKREGKNYVTI